MFFVSKFRVADLFIDKGDLNMMLENNSVRVVPKSKRRELFDEAHSGAMAVHLNGRKSYRQLKKTAFREGMKPIL